MPPRYLVAVFVTFWLGSIALLIYREYLPWWRTDAPPPFIVELADEAAPLIAHWSIYKGDDRVGSATTKMTCLKDDTIELASTIDNLEVNMQALVLSVQIRVVKLHTVQQVTRKGQLLAVHSRVHLVINVKTLGLKVELKAEIKGTVSGGNLYARSKLESPLGQSEQDLEPIPIQIGNVLNPMQPIAKMSIQPGQHWKMTNVDPLGEAMNAALLQFAKQALKNETSALKLKIETPKEILAQVGSQPREWKYEGKSISCYVIEYKSDDDNFSGSTWVAIENGVVMRQEITRRGDRLVLEREN